VASAQATASGSTADSGTTEPLVPALGGTTAIDVIRLSGNSPNIPLRFGGVVAGSEIVDLNGVTLHSNTDYELDASSGMVYLMRQTAVGDILRVSYRHIAGAATTSSSVGGLGLLSFALAPGAINLRLGLGLADRQSDGSVLTSNLYGLSNSLGFGQGKLSGLLFLGEREQVDSQSGLDATAKTGSNATGASEFVVQQLSTKVGGATIQANFQDVSKNFTSFSAVQDSGVDKTVVDQLAKEKGLTRMGFGVDGLKMGGANLTESFKKVSDGSSSIEWQSVGLAQGGFQLNWTEQSEGTSFSRFSDLAEANRAQLAKDAGITRDEFAGSYAAKIGKLSFDDTSIADSTQQGVDRRTVSWDSTKLKFNMGQQAVTSGFTRGSSISDAQGAQWARERGMSRDWVSMDYTAFGAKSTPLHFEETSLSGQGGSFMNTDVSAMFGKWSIDHRAIGTANGTAAVAALAPTEVTAAVQSIAGLYPQVPAKVNASENGLFQQEGTLDRSLTKIQGDLGKSWKMSLYDIGFKGASDSAKLDDLQLASKQFTLDYRDERIGQNFSEISTMMGFETSQLGTLAGFDRTDLNMSGKLSGQKTFSFSDTTESTGPTNAGLDRTTLNYADKGFSFSGGMRDEGSAFGASSLMGDSESSLLTTLVGFKEADYHLKWAVRSSLNIDSAYSKAYNDSNGDENYTNNTIVNWMPDKNTTVNYVDQGQKSDDPLSVIFANSVERLTLTRNMGRYGIFQYMKEDVAYDGTTTTTPGSHKEYFSYETKLNSTTSVKTEETTTNFDDGTKENISANTVSTQLTKKVGVSVTQLDDDHNGSSTAQDQKKQNYGMWWDIGNGMRLSYGCARQLAAGTDAETQSLGISATPGATAISDKTPGKIGDIGVTSFSNSITDTNSIATQLTSKVQLSTLQPMKFGFLHDVKMSFSYDALDNQTTWARENQYFGFNGKLGSNTLAAEYKGQLVPGTGQGIDRTLGFTTDQNEKLPFRASVSYKERTVPNGQDVMIRNYTLLARPAKGFELSNSLLTNPEVANGNALLGSTVQATRANKWKLDYKGNGDTVIGASWEEMINDQTQLTSRTAGLNLTLRGKSGSPITFFYGIEDSNPSIGVRHLDDQYHIEFDQRAGPNQTLSFYIGNVSYVSLPATGFGKENLSLRLDYQLRF
jgi:hypothetical protein